MNPLAIRAIVILLVVAAVGGYIGWLKIELADCNAEKATIAAAHQILVGHTVVQNDAIDKAKKAGEQAKERGRKATEQAEQDAKTKQGEIDRLKAAQAGKGTCGEALNLIRGQW